GVRVTDGDGGVATDSTSVTVNNVAPTLAPLGGRTVAELSALDFTATATDPGASDALTFSLQGAVPAGAGITPDGHLTWTPTEAQDGTYTVTVRVTDPDGDFDEEAVTVTVTEVETAPALADPGDRAVDELTPLSLTLAGSDPDVVGGTPQGLTYS